MIALVLLIRYIPGAFGKSQHSRNGQKWPSVPGAAGALKMAGRKEKYMRLYAGNAHQYLGKKIDRKKRIFGYYPMEVKQFPDGKYYVKDAVGVCMPLPENEDDFNAVNFDFVVND